MVAEEAESYGWLYGAGGGKGGKLTMQKLRQRDALLVGLHTQDLASQKMIGKLDFKNRPRPKYDHLVMVWSVIMGLYHIYFNGTFAIFSVVMTLNSDANGRYMYTPSCGIYSIGYVRSTVIDAFLCEHIDLCHISLCHSLSV
jgi:hypothetical protein